jgi:hypothetical protein
VLQESGKVWVEVGWRSKLKRQRSGLSNSQYFPVRLLSREDQIAPHEKDRDEKEQ